MKVFKARHAIVSASALRAAACLLPQARCLCAVQLVRTGAVSPHRGSQSHQHSSGASIFLSACAAALVSAALAHDREAAAEALDTSGLTDVAGVVRWASLAHMHQARRYARTHARAQARTHTHSLRCLAARHGLM